MRRSEVQNRSKHLQKGKDFFPERFSIHKGKITEKKIIGENLIKIKIIKYKEVWHSDG